MKFHNYRSRQFHRTSNKTLQGLSEMCILYLNPEPATCIMTSSNGNISGVSGPLCREFTGHHKGQWRGDFMFSLICALNKGWVNNLEANHLRCHRTHYDVTVMLNKPPARMPTRSSRTIPLQPQVLRGKTREGIRKEILAYKCTV